MNFMYSVLYSSQTRWFIVMNCSTVLYSQNMTNTFQTAHFMNLRLSFQNSIVNNYEIFFQHQNMHEYN